MKRHKRRKTKGFARCIAAVLVPAAAAFGAKGAAGVIGSFDGTEAYTTGITEKAAANHINADEEVIKRISAL